MQRNSLRLDFNLINKTEAQIVYKMILETAPYDQQCWVINIKI